MRRFLRALLAAALAFGPAAPASAANARVSAAVRSAPVVSLPGLGLFSVSPLSSSSGLVAVRAVGPAEAAALAAPVARIPAPLAPAAARGAPLERSAAVPAAFERHVARIRSPDDHDRVWAAHDLAKDLQEYPASMTWREQLGLLRAISPYAADPRVSAWLDEPMRRLGDSSPAAAIHYADTLTEIYSSQKTYLRYNSIERMTAIAALDTGARESVRRKLASRIPGAAEDAGARELADLLPRLDEAGTQAAMVVIGAEMRRSPSARGELWPLLRRAGQASRPRLEELAGRRRSGGTEKLRSKLPELWRALREPGELGRLLSSLSLLRQAVPYYSANASALAPLEWAGKNAAFFEYGGLRIAPVSESFRRFIVTNEKGDYAVELKVPGQERDRDWIGVHNFTLAQRLDEVLPGRVARPVYFAQFKGSLRLFGGRRRFDDDDTLGILVLEYEDSKRLSNAGGLLERVARDRGATKDDVMLDAKAEMALAAAWLHAKGWAGESPERGNDMHQENIRITTRGRVQLVADFGAFERRKIPLEAQRAETLTLLGDFITTRDPTGEDPFYLRELTPEEIRAIYVSALRRLRRLPKAERAAVRRQLELELAPKTS